MRPLAASCFQTRASAVRARSLSRRDRTGVKRPWHRPGEQARGPIRSTAPAGHVAPAAVAEAVIPALVDGQDSPAAPPFRPGGRLGPAHRSVTAAWPWSTVFWTLPVEVLGSSP